MADSRRNGSGFLKSSWNVFQIKKLQANSLFFEFVYSLAFRNGPHPNHNFKKQTCFTFFMDESLTGLKKFATLLPNNWLAKTPQALALMRLGRQSAERERFSEISWNVFQKKSCRQTRFSSSLSTV
ncbi:hypothetical protein [Peribacillus simplex]|uniref:hypothetical protein n=1 Tax=Peribacillus simplex TaxID=1478 RepID=UPI0011DE08A7|nr:hypothetical protein [Peribacillus simplex]